MTVVVVGFLLVVAAYVILTLLDLLFALGVLGLVIAVVIVYLLVTRRDRQPKLPSGTGRSSIEDPEVAAAVAECLAQGRKIEAVKRYRDATGVPLKDAVRAIDAW